MAGGGAFQVQAEFYVSPTGNDANAGTETAPFRTIERARTAVRTLTSGMTGDIVVYLRGGVHTLANTVTFSTQDSGQNGFQVIYAAYPGETPMLSGGQRITNWVPSGGNLYKAAVGTLRFRQLYVNGKRAIRARTPDAGSYYEVRNWDIGGRRIEVAKDEIGNWQRRNQAELVILGAGVNQSNLRVGGVSMSGNSAFITPLEPERTRIFQQVYPPKSQYRPFYFENAFELLDSPGEWYLNTDTNEVYYWPLAGENPSVAEVVAPRLEQLVSVVGTLNAPVHDLQFRGLTFEHTTWLVPSSEGYVGDQASIVFTQPLPDDEISSYPGHRLPAGVHVEAANTIRFERNVFRHMGASALNLYRAVNDAVVVGNVILDVSASGISVDLNLQGNPSDQRVISRRTRLTNNYIAETGRDYYQSVGIMLGYTDAAVVEHNELQDMPYSGISVGWGWDNVDSALRDNVIRYNRIQRVLNFMSDGGGIYTLSKQPGTLIAENYVRDIVRTSVQGGFNISGIYLDEGSSQITVRDNVLVNTGDRGLFQNGNGPGNTADQQWRDVTGGDFERRARTSVCRHPPDAAPAAESCQRSTLRHVARRHDAGDAQPGHQRDRHLPVRRGSRRRLRKPAIRIHRHWRHLTRHIGHRSGRRRQLHLLRALSGSGRQRQSRRLDHRFCSRRRGPGGHDEAGGDGDGAGGGGDGVGECDGDSDGERQRGRGGRAVSGERERVGRGGHDGAV